VAHSASGDRPVSSTNGRSKDSIAPARSALAGEQLRVLRSETLADVLAGAEQSASSDDQTLSDSDQTLSDVDQTNADSDQTSADSDQVAADRDQAASDHDLAAGGDRDEHGVSRDIRQHSAHEREQTADRRDQSAHARLRAAEQRDATAYARDVAALERDQTAAARDVAIVEVGLAHERADGAPALSGADRIVGAAARRQRAAEQRAKAAEHRAMAAEDRLLAERDREEAARERRIALVDREMLVQELRREHELRGEALAHQHRAEQLARTLQRSLSPPSLPQIAGLDVAVHYEASAPEDVGGDFYDLFPLAAGRSGFFLGDVCGKGPEAAAITSLARYTMRTAAMLHESPDAILMDLNAALLMHAGEAMQTCAAVYGQIDMSVGAASIMLAVAGHPPPLIVRADGGVETTSAHGTMLGVVEDPLFHTCEVNLELGDAIVLSSDGIHDATLGGTRVDEQRVAELLSGSARASAQEVVNRLVSAVADIQRPLRDDIAIMTLRRITMG
jgi:serine phosphatase RsbU (regulator of sigma subunit)